MRAAASNQSLTAAALLFAFFFSLYGLTTSDLRGYEPETAGVVEGLVHTGSFQILEGSPLESEGRRGADGRLYGRVGLPQPLAEAPFYAIGWAADSLNDEERYTYRKLTLSMFNPFLAAMAVAGVFGIVLLRRRSFTWAVATAFLFGAASLTWPYAKIGMETTLMWAVVFSVLTAVLAAERDTLWAWAGTGFMTGIAIASKPYSILVVAPLLALLLPTLRASNVRGRLTRLVALTVPVLAWMGAMVAYNLARFGTILESEERYDPTLAAPINAAGFFLSSGKGLIFFSPVALAGVIALRSVWRKDRPLAVVIAGMVSLGTLAVAGSNHWSDETWGPRYIVPVAWLLVIAIPWWATTRSRRRLLAALALLALTVQLVAVLAPYPIYAASYRSLTGVGLFDRLDARRATTEQPLGRDPLRWIPQVSPLVVQGAAVSSWVWEGLGNSPIVLRYTPYEGQANSLDMRALRNRPGLRIPDVWWAAPRSAADPGPNRQIAVALLAVGLASLVGIARLVGRLRLAGEPDATPRVGSGPPAPLPTGRLVAPTSNGSRNAGAKPRVRWEGLGWIDRLLGAASLRSIESELDPGENVLGVAIGKCEGAVCGVAASPVGILIGTRPRATRVRYEEIERIDAVDGSLGGHLSIECAGRAHEIEMIWPGDRAESMRKMILEARRVRSW